MGRYFFVLFACLFFFVACGESESGDELVESQASPASPGMPASTDPYSGVDNSAADLSESQHVYTMAEDRTRRATADDPAGLGQGGETVAAVDRKVIHNARVDLVVDDFDPVGGQVRALVLQHGGYIASSQIAGSAGEPRTGRWTIRVPVGAYDALLAESEGIGQVREMESSSQEVTAEFVDLQARIRSKSSEEERLLEHLEEALNLDNTLRIERELTRVRGEIERLQGRLTLLGDLASLSTVTLTVSEIKDYAPAPTQEPGYTAQLGRAWAGSVVGLGDFLTALSVVLVTLMPWLVLIGPAMLLGFIVLRRSRRSAAIVKA